jgi:colanic acid/amylovoran biosynthesis protein
MILEVYGTSVFNKGAELMQMAVAEHFATLDPAIQLAVGPLFGPYAARARHGLLYKVVFRGRPGRARLGYTLLPRAFRRACGLVDESEVAAVVDASGFAIGDQLPVGTARRMAADVARWKRQGKPVVLLPQAFGPFEKEEPRRLCREIATAADLVAARDPDSLRHARKAAPAVADRIVLAPDITIGIEGIPPTPGLVPPATALLVPNARMLDRTGAATARAYLPFLARCAHACRSAGLHPAILIHDDGEDDALVEPLRTQSGLDLPVLHEPDPRRLKGLLAAATLVVGSRFHALLGALSSGTPAVAAGWSHKYERLFDDFGCSHLTVTPDADTPRITTTLTAALSLTAGPGSNPLLERKQRMIEDLRQLWRRVDSILGLAG